MFDDDAVMPEDNAGTEDVFGGADELPSTPSSSENNAGGDFSNNGGGGYADEVFSTKIATKFRVFYIDLKESRNGKFVKISEKSRGGKRSTIMFDGEDIDAFLEAFTELKGHM